jgi:BirA family biotin operon repressor/biotin-[acetyl-CoA-carboxylase] ligase
MCAFDKERVGAGVMKQALEASVLQIPITVLETVDSTNTYAKCLAAEGEREALIVALEQSAGRGRMGRSFYSPSGSGIYMSILHTFHIPICNAVSVTSAASVAVMRAVRRICGVQTEIKWVNDLYLNGKKVCGILAESMLIGNECAVVVGIGINLRSAAFPAELSDIAGTLGADDADAAALVAAIVEELEPFLQDPLSREWLEDYRVHSCVIGRRVVWMKESETYGGVASDIDENGSLIVLADTGEMVSLRTGEITLRLN